MIIEQSTYKTITKNTKEAITGIQTLLPVMESFYSLQGEGFYQGHAAYFIRLGGCDVGCFWCDVKESWNASLHAQQTAEQIIEEAKEIIAGMAFIADKPIVVITGGEPLLHNLNVLTRQLKENNFRTHMETSGSSRLSGYWDWICLSPKKFKHPLSEVYAAANELKVIVYNKSDFRWAEENAKQVSDNCKLYLQPEWSKINSVTPEIINYIQANPKWQLSLQIHKYLNIR